MRAKIIAANWKMDMKYPEGLALFSNMIDLIHAEVTGTQQTVVCCPLIHLHALAQLAVRHSSISVAAENEIAGIAQAKPEESLYIDDTLLFVEVMRDLGMNAIHYQGLEDAKRQLKEVGLRLE